MKKIIQFMSICAIVISMLSATVVANGIGNPDNECQDQGFDFGIAKFECDDDSWSMSDDDGFPPEGYDVSASGEDCSSVDWESNPAAAGVIEKAGQEVFIHDGGFSGTVGQSGQHAISHLTLCGNEEVIPEFSRVAAGMAIAGAGLGYIALRKRK
ncbi:MAG: hypothetical protein AABX51_06920 [Nanoarchaeota archaeon]